MSDSAIANPLSESGPWNLVAKGYKVYTQPFFTNFVRSAMDKLALSSNDEVIDIAAGSGTATLEIASHVRRVLAVDFAMSMVQELQIALDDRSISNVEVQHGDGQKLEVGSASFDVGICMFGIIFFPDRSAGFRELSRVVRPGGKIVVSSFAPVERSPLMQCIGTVIGAAFSDEESVRALNRTSALEDPDQFRRELQSAGFVDIEISAVEHELVIDSLEAFWESTVVSKTSLALLRQQVGADAWREKSRLAIAKLAELLPSLPTSLGCTAWIATARNSG